MNHKAKRNTIILLRMFNAGLHNIVRNVWLTTAATAVMMVTLSILLLSGLANLALAETIDDRTDDFALGVYLNDDIDQVRLDAFRQEVESKEYVDSVTFISKEEARQKFIAQYEDEDFVNQGLALTDENILPASFDVRFNDLELVDEILSLTAAPEYEDMIYATSDTQIRRQSIEQYLSIKESINMASLVAVGLFGVISVLIVFNTIRMAVFSRSREIEIMKLIGATRNYIRGPFLVEAALYGIIAALIAFSLAYSLMLSVLPDVNIIKSADTVKLFSDYWYAVLGGTVALGSLIGLISSWLATARYLKFKRW